MKVYEAVVVPAAGGFGCWDMKGRSLVEDVQSIHEWVDRLTADGISVREAPEIDGLIYRQSGAKPFCVTFPWGESFHAVWEENEFVDENIVNRARRAATTVAVLHVPQRLGAQSSDETGKTWCGRSVYSDRLRLVAPNDAHALDGAPFERVCEVCLRACDAWLARGH